MLHDPFHKSPVWRQSVVVVRRCHWLAGQVRAGDELGLAKSMRATAVDLPQQLAAAFAESDDERFEKCLDEMHARLQKLDAVLSMAADLRALNGWRPVASQRIRRVRGACVRLADLLEAERPDEPDAPDVPDAEWHAASSARSSGAV